MSEQTRPLLAPAKREQYLLALTELMGTLSTTKSTQVDEFGFCQAHGLKPTFFLAVRDLDGLVMDPVKSDGGIMFYTRTPELAKLTPEQVYAKMRGAARWDKSPSTATPGKEPAPAQEAQPTNLSEAMQSGLRAADKVDRAAFDKAVINRLDEAAAIQDVNDLIDAQALAESLSKVAESYQAQDVPLPPFSQQERTAEPDARKPFRIMVANMEEYCKLFHKAGRAAGVLAECIQQISEFQFDFKAE